MSKAETVLRVLANEKPEFRAVKAPVAQHVMRMLRPMENNYTNPGFFQEPREVISLNVM